MGAEEVRGRMVRRVKVRVVICIFRGASGCGWWYISSWRTSSELCFDFSVDVFGSSQWERDG